MEYDLKILNVISIIRGKIYNELSKEFNLKNEEFYSLVICNKNCIDLSLISQIKDKFTKNMFCNKEIPRLINISEENLMLTEINQFLINKYLRLIVRKEFKVFDKVRSLSTFFRPNSNYQEVAVFFYVISKFLFINKLKFDLFKPKNFSDLSIFIVFDYIINNNNISKIEINSDISFEIDQNFFDKNINLESLSIFDIVSLKQNLRDLTINIRNYTLNLCELNRILKRLNLKRLVLNDLYEIECNGNDDWENFFLVLSSHKRLEKFVFNYSYKYNFKKKITFSQKTLQLLMSFYCTFIDIKHFEICDISNTITQDLIDFIKNSSNILNKKIKFSRLILIISFNNIRSFNFINFTSLIELNVGPLDFFSLKYLTHNLKVNNYKNIVIRLKDDKFVVNLENYLEYFSFFSENSFYCDNFELLGFDFIDDVLIALKQILIQNTSIKCIVLSYFPEFVKPDELCVREYNEEYFYYGYDIKKISVILYSFKMTSCKLRMLKSKPRILKIISDFFIKKYRKVVYLLNLTNINLVINYL